MRTPTLSNDVTVYPVLTTIRQRCSTFGFAIYAYCFMPDHLHLVVVASSEASDFQRFMNNWKQRTGYDFKRRNRASLWQESYFDHVLRDDEETKTAVKYVLENPVRRGMVKTFDEYPYSGSDVYSLAQLHEFWQV